MTSQRASTSAPSFDWDHSHLHAERAARRGVKGKPLRGPPSSSGVFDRRTSNMTSTTTTTATSSSPFSKSGQTKTPDSDLTTSFDPMKDMHMWTMWRVAVNGRIVDEVRKGKQTQPNKGEDFDWTPFGKALVKTPLDRFIRVENGSQSQAGLMMDPHGEGGGHLATAQFVFYGVPRVVLKKPRHTTHLPQ